MGSIRTILQTAASLGLKVNFYPNNTQKMKRGEKNDC